MASGDFTDLKEWSARTARFDVSNSTDMALAGQAVNDAYISTCADGSPWDFLQQEGSWITSSGSDVYTYATIASAMSITGASIAEIQMLAQDNPQGRPLESMGWEELENYSHSTQDDPTGEPIYWSKWASRIRLWPTPDAAYTLGTFVRLAPAEMSASGDVPLIPLSWRRRLLVPFAAAILLRTEGGLETAAEARGLMESYDRDFIAFRTAYATAKKPTFRVTSPGWAAIDDNRSGSVFGAGW